jgi:hypothetical protein
MAAMEDIARLRLEILGDEAEKTVESLNSGLKDVNAELKLMELNGDKGSEAWRELKKVQNDIKGELKELSHNVDLNDMSWNQLNATARKLRNELNNLTIGSDEWIAKLKQISEVDEKIDGTRAEMKKLKGDGEEQTSTWSVFKGTFAAAFTLQAVIAAASAIFDFGMEVFNMTAKFERYETVLKTALGGQDEAIAAMQMVKDIAASTPVSVDEMTDSFIKFVNRGVQPTKDELKNFADLAASQGKSFDQLTEAVLDAQTGEYERLKEFGIKAKTVGDEVELSFKGQTISVEKNEEAIYKAINAMGDYNGVAGMTSEMSETLEGRTSNLGDKFDFLMVSLGEKLKPAFIGIIDLIDRAATWFGELVASSDPLITAFGYIWDIVVQIVGIGKDLLFVVFPGLQSESVNTASVMRVLGTVFGVVADVLKFFVSTIEVAVDMLKVLANASNIFAAALILDFDGVKAATAATGKAWDEMNANAKKNFTSVGDATKAAWQAGLKGAEENIKAVDMYGKLAKKTEEDHTTNSKKESDKRTKEAQKEAADRLKANTDSIKKQQDYAVAAIADETAKKVAAEKLKYDRERDRINKTKADEKNKAKELEALEKAHNAALLKIEKDHLAKLKAEETKKEKEEEKARKDKAAAEKKANDARVLATKAVFTADFQAFVANKNLEMSLTTTTSARKIQLMTEESNWKKLKLQEEGAAEKAKIATQIADETARAAIYKSIDERLAADLKASDAKLQADKTKQLEEAHKARQDNTKQFFTAINDMAQGDYTAFMAFLEKKVKNDASANQERLKDFSAKGVETLEIAAEVVNTMQVLNEMFTAKKLAQIEKQKQSQIDSWTAEYNSGKISKEEYEAKISDINKEAAKKEHEAKVKAWKRDQAMQIAMAVINGAMAALKSLATMGFPLGLIGVAASAVMTGIQIAIIKGQKPPEAPSFKSGGYVRNAGVPDGSNHGTSYGKSGIALWDRETGQEVGEMQGKEPIMILSQETYKNNGDVVDKLMDSSLNRNGARIFANGGYLNYLEPLQYGRMYEYGTPRTDAEEMDGGGSIIPSTTGMDSASAATTATSQAAIEASQKVQQEIADNAAKTAEAVGVVIKRLDTANSILENIKNKPTGISLHDLQAALNSATAAGRKSNL